MHINYYTWEEIWSKPLKKYDLKRLYDIIAILTICLCWACASDDSVGTEGTTEPTISFNAGFGASSRAYASRAYTQGEAAADMLGRSFMVYGTKTVNNINETVFKNYTVQYASNSANTTQTNTSNWEYVLSGQSLNQTIKYWDYSASQYTFCAIAPSSLGTFTTAGDGNILSATINLSAPADDSATLPYFTDPVIVNSKDNYGSVVTLPFKSALSRIRFAMYETIPGYRVNDVKFYTTQENATANTHFVANGQFVTGGEVSLRYDHANSKTTMDWSSSATKVSNYSFSEQLTYDGADAENKYIGTLSSNPSYFGADKQGYYVYLLPHPTNITELSLICDYTLVSEDGSGQKIEVKGANAIVPSQYCQWKPNYSYTYLFKLTDSQLNPITFVAYGEIDNTTNNQQGTITTVGDYSITTYQEGSTDESGINYEVNMNVEVSVVYNEGSATPVQIDLDGDDDYLIIYHQKTFNEWVVEMDTSESTDPAPGIYKETIEKEGTEKGYANMKGNFIPDVTGTYRVEYWHKDEGGTPRKLAVKIVKIRGNTEDLDLYQKWQTGTSNTEPTAW